MSFPFPTAMMLAQSTPVAWDLSHQSGLTLSNGNLTVSNNPGDAGTVLATSSKSTGKFYFEVTYDTGGDTNTFWQCGVADATMNIASFSSSHGGFPSGGMTAAGVSSVGSVVGIAVDLSAGWIWWQGNGGTWRGDTNNGTPDPAAGTGGFAFASRTAPYRPCVNLNSKAFATMTTTAHFAASSFTYAAPTTFGPWP
jgi:hypothetical protein